MRKRRSLFKILSLFFAFALLAVACGDSGSSDNATGTTATTAAESGGGGGDTATTTTAAPAPSTTNTPVTEAETGPVYGGTLVVATEAEAAGWAPWQDPCSAPCVNVHRALYDQLLELNSDGQIVGYAAEGIEPNADLTEWTLTLRDGIKFHDGSALNADTVVDAYNMFQKDGPITSGIYGAAGVTSVEKVDDMTVKYVLSSGNAGFPDILTGVAGRIFSVEAAKADPEGFSANPVGSGPFVFGTWDRDNKLTLTRNPDYWRTDPDGNQLPYLDELIFRPIPDETTRLQSVIAGDVDVAQTLRQSTIRDAKAEGDSLKLLLFQGNNSGGAIFNVLEPPVDDVRVRQGLAWAMDQDLLIDILGGKGISDKASQFFSPDSPWYSQKVADMFPNNDVTKAIPLLQEYVDDPNRSDGKAPGDPIEVEFNCPPDPSLIQLSQGYQQLWEGTGLVKVNLNQVEQAAHISNAVGSPDTDPPFRGDFMINCWRVGGQGDPAAILGPAFAPVEASPVNFTNFFDPAMFDLLNQAKATADFDARYKLYEEVMTILAEQVPVVYTGYTATALITRPNVEGIGGWHVPNGDLGQGFPNAEGRYVETFLTEG